jgi:hypothetical protein
MAKKAGVKPETSAVEASTGAAALAAAPAKKTRTPRAKTTSVQTDGSRKPAPRTSAKPAVPERAPSPAVVIDLSREEVARLAYSYWEARGYQGGSPLEDWVRAENELRKKTPALTK